MRKKNRNHKSDRGLWFTEQELTTLEYLAEAIVNSPSHWEDFLDEAQAASESFVPTVAYLRGSDELRLELKSIFSKHTSRHREVVLKELRSSAERLAAAPDACVRRMGQVMLRHVVRAR